MELSPIARVHTCFKEKFGIPRQPNLVKEAPGQLVFYPEYAREEAVRGLEQFSHIWLVFVFHQAMREKEGQGRSRSTQSWSTRSWSPMVRPPRLGGNQKVGVFASRSPFRPNPIGLSCVKLVSIAATDQGPVLNLAGVDLMDGTPILDIKPYLPYSDILPTATDGFAPGPPPKGNEVFFSPKALQDLDSHPEIPDLKAIITGILANDPRPAYAADRSEDRVYGIRLFDLDLKFRFEGNRVLVLALDPTP